MRLEFSIDGNKDISRNLRIAAEKMGSMKPAMYDIGNLVRAGALQNISQQGSESGGKWKPLSQRTLEMRRRRRGYYRNAGSGSQVLVWSGALRDGFRVKADSDSVVIDNPVPYFKYHQAQNRAGKLPRRLSLELKATNKKEAMEIVAREINKNLNG